MFYIRYHLGKFSQLLDETITDPLGRLKHARMGKANRGVAMNVVVGRARTREFASSSETLRPVRPSKRKERKKNNIPGVDLVITAHTLAKNMLHSQRKS